MFCKKYQVLFLILTLLIFFLIIIFPGTSIYFKNNILDRIGVKRLAYTKILINQTIYRYIHPFDKDITINSLYNKIWRPVFDPMDPDAWSGVGNYKVVQKLSGRNVEMIPVGSKGYLFDSTCLGMASPYHAYYFLLLRQDSVQEGDSVLISAYCYVTEDFNGSGAAVRAEGSVKGNPDKFYDLNNKGCWQKLVLPLNCRKGIISTYLYMNKAGVANFSTLKGGVYFAYPEIKIISQKSIISDTSRQISFLNRYYFKNREVDKSLSKNESPSFPAEIIYKSSFLNSDQNEHFAEVVIKDHHDPLRRWIAKLVSEDTVYHGFKANLVIDSIKDDFGEDRTSRWKFALEIFNKEYNWHQKILGGGFNSLNWYGYFYLKDKTRSDYPHNPFLSVLLYSGIIGLILYFILLYKVFFYYIRYFKEYKILAVFFIISFFFSFFSAGNPFDPPVMGFFVLLPFFIHSVHERERKLNKIESKE